MTNVSEAPELLTYIPGHWAQANLAVPPRLGNLGVWTKR
jgi:hypothetical protein